MGPAGQGPWPGRAGLWRVASRPCCGLTGAGGPGAAVGAWALAGSDGAGGQCPFHS